MRAIIRFLPLAAAALGLVPALPAAAEGTPVGTVRVERSAVVETLNLVGTVVAPRSAAVSSEVASRVAAVEAALGDRVEAGAALVRLDDVLENLALERDRAAARAEEARLADARRRLEDGRRLSARDNLPANEVETRRAEVAAAEARLAAERAEIARREARIERHVVRAPFDGTVVERMVDAGEWVEPGMPVVALVATDRLVVDLAVPQRHYSRIAADTDVTLGFEALPGERVAAAVVARVPRGDPTARTFRLRVRPRLAGREIAPGMSARADLRLATTREAVVVPRDAIMRYPDGRVTVWIVAEGEGGPVAEERVVTLGAGAGEGRVYVTGGLEDGARVVTRGNESLDPGQAVSVENDGDGDDDGGDAATDGSAPAGGAG